MDDLNIEFYGAVELELSPGGGKLIRRFPKTVRDALSPLGRMVSQESAGCADGLQRHDQRPDPSR